LIAQVICRLGVRLFEDRESRYIGGGKSFYLKAGIKLFEVREIRLIEGGKSCYLKAGNHVI
jgi:hypothetical protein